MFLKQIKNKIVNFILNKKEIKAPKLLWLFILLYIALFLFLVFKRYYYFSYNASDLAIFNQTFFNTIHGRWFEQTFTLNNYLGDHFSPIIFLLLPIYFFLPSPLTLVSLQTIGLALAAWPLFYLASKLIQNKKLVLLICLFWLLNPMVQSANLDENHLLYLVPLFVFWAAYFYQQKSFYKFLLFFILALLVREDIAFIMIAWSLVAYLDKRSKKWLFVPLFLSGFYFLLAMEIISRFSLAGSYKYFNYYGWLGGHDLVSIIISWLSHPFITILHLFSLNNIGSVLVILLPLLYIPFLQPRYLSLSVLPFLQLAMSATGLTSVAYMTRFSLLLLPGIFLAFVFSLKYLSEGKKFFASQIVYRNIVLFKLFLVVSLVYFTIFLSPAQHVLFKRYNNQQQTRQQSVVKAIPPTASILATSNFLPKLSSRQAAYNIDYAYFGKSQFSQTEFKQPPVDYLVIDYSDFFTTISDAQVNKDLRGDWSQMPARWRQFLQDYNIMQAEDNILLWQNKNLGQALGLKLYEIKDKNSVSTSSDFLIEKNSLLNQNHRVLKLTCQKINNIDENYLVRFYIADYYFDMPLDYGMLSQIDWQDKIVSFYYYLDPSVDSFQIFTWQGLNKLGLENNVIVDKKIKAVTDKQAFIDS